MTIVRKLALLLAVTALGLSAHPLTGGGRASAQDTTATKGGKKAKEPKPAKPGKAAPATAADSARQRQEKVAKDSVEAERLPLFASHDAFPLTLIANFKTIGRDRDSTSKVRYPGTLVVKDETGVERRIPVELRTRGHFRLRRSTCSFVNLLVIFPGKKKELEGTPFDGQKSLKLGGHCQDDNRYETILRREYLAYRIFHMVTPRAFRARLATATYVDSASSKPLTTRLAMFIEHEDDVAARQGGRIREFRRALFADMEPATLDQMSIFEYLIGNTDFSIYALHNVRLVVTESGKVLPIPYDFDFSGLAGAPYAVPPPQLAIRNVRERMYRGPCRTWSELEPSVQRFAGRQQEILALVDQVPQLAPNDARDVRDYLREFFATIGNARQAQAAFIAGCVNKPGV